MEIKISEAEKMVILELHSKRVEIENKLKQICDNIAEVRGKSIEGDVVWKLSEDYNSIIIVEGEDDGSNAS